jgi:hypothetical protein
MDNNLFGKYCIGSLCCIRSGSQYFLEQPEQYTFVCLQNGTGEQ